MKCFAAVILLLAIAGTGLAQTANPAPQPQKVLVQFSVGTGATLVGLKVTRQVAPATSEPVAAPGRFCLRLPFDCALVVESVATDGSGVVVRPRFGPIAFEVAVDRVRPSGS